jgi:hypothetical protein
VPTGVAPLDDALGGGLPAGRLTELVCAAPSAGGQTAIAGLLGAAQGARQRIALIDASDGFVPDSVPEDALRHLVWVRCRSAEQAFSAADILVRDGNYVVVALDLRGAPARALRRVPSTAWYRLQRAAEAGAAAVLVQTEFPLVPAAAWRLRLAGPLALADTGRPRAEVAAGLGVRAERAPTAAALELAG